MRRKNWRLEDKENALWKHCVIQHDGMRAEFEMKMLKTFNSCFREG